jgi:hypothetical protein
MKTATRLMRYFAAFVASRTAESPVAPDLGPVLRLRDFDDYERHVVVGRAVAVRGDTVENLFFHFLQGQLGGLANDFTEAFDAQHVALLVETFGEAVGVNHEAIAGLDGDNDGGVLAYGVFDQAENGAAGFEKARGLAGLNDHGGRMAGVGKFEGAIVAVEARGNHREIKHRRSDIAEHEAIEVVHHGAERDAAFDLRHGFGVDAIGDEGRADAVAGNVADEKAERILPRRDQSEVAANCANGLIVGGDIDAAPGESRGREALLHAGSEQKILFDFLVALFELYIRFAQGVFGALLLGDVCGGDHGEHVAVGVLNLACGDEHWQAIPVRLGEIELVLAMPFRLPLLDAITQYLRALGGIQIQNLAADQFFFRDANHLQEQAIGEEDVAAIVVDDDALIDGFQDAGHFANPGECFRHGVLAFVGQWANLVRCKFSAGTGEVETDGDGLAALRSFAALRMTGLVGVAEEFQI